MSNGRFRAATQPRYITSEELNSELAEVSSLVQKDMQALSTSLQRDMISLSSTVDKLANSVETRMNSVTAQFNSIANSISSQGKITWSNFGILFGIAVTAMGLLGTVITILTNQTVSPIITKVAQIDTNLGGLMQDMREVQRKADASQQADAQSVSNRHEMGEQINLLRQTQASISADLKALTSKVDATGIEIETQFKGQSNIENLRWIDEHRRYAIIFQQVFKFPYPSGGFFPPSNFREVK